jgi:hypothetical protein
MKTCIIFVVFLLFFVNNIYSQSGTFDFESATSSGTPHSVTQTVNSRTVTISSSVNFEVVDPLVDYSMSVGGITGKTAINPFDVTQNITISFNGTVNIRTLKVYDGTQSNSSGTMTFVPVGGSNSTVNYTPSPNHWDADSKLVTLNWVGITAINITAPYSLYWGFDDIVMDASLPVELTSFTASTANNKVTLNWQTATEVNNYGFEVERRAVKSEQSTRDSWQKIGFVSGAGMSNAPKEYSYSDASVCSGNYVYRLKQIDHDGTFKYSQSVEVSIQLPAQFMLNQNYPNPFNPNTIITYQLQSVNHVTLKVFDVLGKEVATLVNEVQQPGNKSVRFDASALASGIYYYRLQSGYFNQTKKLLLLK